MAVHRELASGLCRQEPHMKTKPRFGRAAALAAAVVLGTLPGTIGVAEPGQNIPG